MEILSSIITVFILFFIINYLSWYITEVKGLPQWLQYKPWICRLCLTFWSLIAVYCTIWASFQCLYIGTVGIALAIMNAIAMYIDQKNNTVKIEDMDEILGK